MAGSQRDTLHLRAEGDMSRQHCWLFKTHSHPLTAGSVDTAEAQAHQEAEARGAWEFKASLGDSHSEAVSQNQTTLLKTPSDDACSKLPACVSPTHGPAQGITINQRKHLTWVRRQGQGFRETLPDEQSIQGNNIKTQARHGGIQVLGFGRTRQKDLGKYQASLILG